MSSLPRWTTPPQTVSQSKPHPMTVMESQQLKKRQTHSLLHPKAGIPHFSGDSGSSERGKKYLDRRAGQLGGFTVVVFKVFAGLSVCQSKPHSSFTSNPIFRLVYFCFLPVFGAPFSNSGKSDPPHPNTLTHFINASA